ncbi:Uncharacterized protein FKW44_022100, partial [Caligus rogercresseyi]
ETVPVYYPSPNISRPASQLTEEEQVKIAQRMGLIQHLPTGSYDGCKKNRECVICMIEFVVGDRVRYLPCMHTYHTDCIDDWLMRSFTCPSCMEPVDAALSSHMKHTKRGERERGQTDRRHTIPWKREGGESMDLWNKQTPFRKEETELNFAEVMMPIRK